MRKCWDTLSRRDKKDEYPNRSHKNSLIKIYMDFQHTLLLLLFFLPLAYKIAFWKEIFSFDESFWKKIQRGYSHFWTYVEFPLFLGSFFVYFNPDLEIFFFNFLLYLFAMMHVFLCGKILRGQRVFWKEYFLNISLWILCTFLCFFIWDFLNPLAIYAGMAFFYILFSFFLGIRKDL